MKDQLTHIVLLITLAFLPTFATSCRAQLIFPGDDHKHGIPLTEFQQLIGKPDGLVKITDIVGDYTFGPPSDRCRWGGGPTNLEGVTKRSTLAVTATIQSAEGLYESKSNSVYTIYTLQVLRFLKGHSESAIKFTALGGKARLSNGHFATMETPEYGDLKVGTTYVLFLSKTADNYEPTSCADQIYRVSADTQVVHAVDSFTLQWPDSRIYEGAQIQGLESEIKALAAQE